MCKATIVVPVYNVQELLPQCLAAIAAQTMADFECILVDDGSTDGSGVICDDQARLDPRFRVIHKENGGVCSARNAGILAAKSPYVILCDQDDCIAPQTLEWALDAQQANPDRLIAWPYTRDRAEFARQPTEYTLSRFARQHTLRYFAGDQFIYVWNKLLPTDVLRGMDRLFDPDLVGGGEDFDFMARFMPVFYDKHPDGGVCQIEAPLYFWNPDNEKSVSKWASNHKNYCAKQFAFFDRVKAAFAPFYQQDEGDIALCFNRMLRPIVFGLVLAKENGETLPDFWNTPQLCEMLSWLKEHRWYTAFTLPLTLKSKALARLMFRWQEQRPALYGKLYWLGYYLLARGWKRV